MLDIDHFKQFKDHYGYPEDDVAIQNVAKLLIKSCLRENDFIARVGDEEFAVILPNTEKYNAKIIAERIQKTTKILNRPHQTSLVTNYLTLSIGSITIGGSGNINEDDIYQLADQALYKAKEKRNIFVIN
jgi:diguanylate cyclase (GGDEF)-like protein